MRTRIHRLTILPIALACALLFGACSGARIPPGLITLEPNQAEVQEIRRKVGMLADGATLANETAEHAGVLLDALPLDVATKNGYDCAILRLNGTNTPSPAQTKVCGELPTVAKAPMPYVRVKLQSVASCPSLKATTALFLGAIQPFVAHLREQASLAWLALALNSSIDFAKSILEGGPTCSQ